MFTLGDVSQFQYKHQYFVILVDGSFCYIFRRGLLYCLLSSINDVIVSNMYCCTKKRDLPWCTCSHSLIEPKTNFVDVYFPLICSDVKSSSAVCPAMKNDLPFSRFLLMWVTWYYCHINHSKLNHRWWIECVHSLHFSMDVFFWFCWRLFKNISRYLFSERVMSWHTK